MSSTIKVVSNLASTGMGAIFDLRFTRFDIFVVQDLLC